MKSRLIGKDPDAGKDWRQEEKGVTEDGVVGWHHQLNGDEFEQTPGDSGGLGSLQSMGLQRVEHDWVTEQQLSHKNEGTLAICANINGSLMLCVK